MLTEKRRSDLGCVGERLPAGVDLPCLLELGSHGLSVGVECGMLVSGELRYRLEQSEFADARECEVKHE